MADEAYRAVFLRACTRRQRCSAWTTEANGKEGEYAELVADELASRRSTSRSFPSTPIASASATATTRARHPEGTRGDRGRCRKDPREGSAAAHGARSATRDTRWPNEPGSTRPAATRRS